VALVKELITGFFLLLKTL